MQTGISYGQCDRGSHYFYTPEADGPVDKDRLIQVGRALKHLGVEHIPACSPEARGRSERMFATLQDRLIKELAKAGIGDIDAANAFIRDVYLPAHNAGFMGLPGKPDGISGADVERYYGEGRIREFAEYCESDVVNTYRVWLRYELFRGRLSEQEFEASEANLMDFIKAGGNTKPHLAHLM